MKFNLISTLKPFMVKHEPEILTGLGITGLVFATVWGVKATVTAVKAVENKKKELKVEKLPVKETIKTTWKFYIPVVVSTAVSIPCIIGGNCIYSKRNAALAAAYTLSETALQQYQDKVTEIVGEKKSQEIQESISKDKITETYSQNKGNVVITGDGDSLFYEPITDRYFKTSWNKILKAANELNAEATNNLCGYITLSDWFCKLGLPSTDISDELGWSIEKKGVRGLIDVSVSSHLTDDNVACGAIYYVNRPEHIDD